MRNDMKKIFSGIVIVGMIFMYTQQRPILIEFTEFEQQKYYGTSDQIEERKPPGLIPRQFSLKNLQIKSLPLISSLKNPCWFQNQSERNGYKLRCLPYFFIAGQPKSATTDLYWQLVKHPDITRGFKKEPHWWTKRRFHLRGTWDSYVNNFILASELQNECGLTVPSQATNISSSCKQRITLDASPSTFWDMGRTMKELKALETLPHSSKATQLLQLLESSQLKPNSKNHLYANSGNFKYSVADLIHLQIPRSRIIVMLRNPVDRIYSGYRFFKRQEQKSTLKFHNEVEQSLKVWNNCLKRHSHQFCIYDPLTSNSMRVRLYVSIYITFVNDWLKVYPRNQILFIRTEDYKENQAMAMTQICEHLELRPFTANTTSKKRKLGNVTKIQLGPMLNTTRKVLTDFYAPFNRQLAKLLEDDRFLWED